MTRRSIPHQAAAQAGFSLLEVLIALVIAMIAITELTHGGGVALRMADTAARHEMAASLARSVLAEQTLALTPGERSGVAADGFAWRVTMRPISTARPVPMGAPAGSAQGAPQVTLFAITVLVTWSDGVEQIETRRLSSRSAGT